VGASISISNNVHDIAIADNILFGNRGFQIGYSELFLEGGWSSSDVAREQRIRTRAISWMARMTASDRERR
jgi:hypothetical protein